MEENQISWIKKHWILMSILGIFLLNIILLGGINKEELGDNEDDNSDTGYSKSVKIGEEGKLYLEGESVVPVCITEEYLNNLVDAAVTKDKVGYSSLLDGYRCYLTSTLEDYGRVLVLKNTIGSVKFRFTNPDSSHYGEIAWTNWEFVLPI
jgi:hypothetical protein